MAWAVENGLSPHGGLFKLPSYKRSFGVSNDVVAGDTLIPFAYHCFRSPSEWHAAFLRQEMRYIDEVTGHWQLLKRSFIKGVAPQHKSYLQDVMDPAGDRSYQVTFVMKSEAEGAAVTKCLRDRNLIEHGEAAWKSDYIPLMASFVQKASYHKSGFPWMTEEDQRPLRYDDYNISNAIMHGSVQIPISWYYTKSMMQYAAGVANACIGSALGRER